MLSPGIFGKSTEYDQDHRRLMEPLLSEEKKRKGRQKHVNINQLIFNIIIQINNIDNHFM